jgi:hypothetical protein
MTATPRQIAQGREALGRIELFLVHAFTAQRPFAASLLATASSLFTRIGRRLASVEGSAAARCASEYTSLEPELGLYDVVN